MQASWSVLDQTDPHVVARLRKTAAEYEFWRTLEPDEEARDTVDWTTYAARLTRSTAMTQAHITRHLDALVTLDQLPKLRALVEATWVLDMHYLSVIDRAAARAPGRLMDDPYFWETLDDALVTRLTPTRNRQLLPRPGTVAKVVDSTIATLQTAEDSSPRRPVPEPEAPERDAAEVQGDNDDGEDTPAGPQPCLDPAELMRSLPPLNGLPPAELWIDTEDDGVMRFELSVDQATGALIHDAIWQVAKTAYVSQARAMVMLMLGQVNTSVTTHLYTAKDVAGAPVFHPLAGVLTEQAANRLLAVAGCERDMDTASTAYTQAYTPTAAIRAYLVGRDWVCRWPGCARPAVTADADHRVNHDEGGPTTPANMVMLCRHHHNRKTDGQATYLLDPVTGDMFWLFADGSWAVDHAEGPLAPTERRWVQTYAQRRRRRNEAAAARAAAEEFEAYQAGAEARAQAKEKAEEAWAEVEAACGPDLPPDTTQEPGRDPPF
jgi:hypothetical protein